MRLVLEILAFTFAITVFGVLAFLLAQFTTF